jgi:N-methylhydantoinase B
LIVRRAGSDTEENLASKVAGLNMKTGDIIRLETAGGGGHGNPKDRSKSDISDDLLEGYTT